MGTVRTIPDKKKEPPAVVRLNKPAMEWELVDLRELLACCRRELSLRQYVFPKRISSGKMTQEKADKELELMRQCVDYFVDAVFRCVTRQASAAGDAARNA